MNLNENCSCDQKKVTIWIFQKLNFDSILVQQGSAPQTPQERRRFTFGKYFERSSRAEKQTGINNEPILESTPKPGIVFLYISWSVKRF